MATRWQRNIVDESGNVIPNAEIEVFEAGTTNKPTLYSDAGAGTSITNPFNADANGFAAFYVEGGLYDISVNGAVIWKDVSLYSAVKDGGSLVAAGLTESVTLSSGVLTIPVGMSTIKLPTTVWDGSSNITISAIAFEGGVQPAVGYEFSVVVPKTTTAGSLTAGALGNEVLIQDGASIAVEANNDQDLPCYPNAADNPGTDPVQFAAPYYRLDFRVDSYDGGGDPVVSLVRLPDPARVANDNGRFFVCPSSKMEVLSNITLVLSNATSEQVNDFDTPMLFADSNNQGCIAGRADLSQGRRLLSNINLYIGDSRFRVGYSEDIEGLTDLDQDIAILGMGEWY